MSLNDQIIFFSRAQALDFDYPEDFEADAKDLTSRLIVSDPEKQLGAKASGGFKQLIRHQFLADIDFETLHLQKPPLTHADRLPPPSAPYSTSDADEPLQDARNDAIGGGGGGDAMTDKDDQTGEDGFNEEDFARAVMMKLEDYDEDNAAKNEIDGEKEKERRIFRDAPSAHWMTQFRRSFRFRLDALDLLFLLLIYPADVVSMRFRDFGGSVASRPYRRHFLHWLD